MSVYKVRKVCEGAEPFHYIYDVQVTIDEDFTCSEHPEAETRDFVVEETMD